MKPDQKFTGYSENNFGMHLKRLCENGNQKSLAKQLRVSPQYLCDVLKGRRAVTKRFAEQLGFRRTIVYEPMEKMSVGFRQWLWLKDKDNGYGC